jgi:hypothetical protein
VHSIAANFSGMGYPTRRSAFGQIPPFETKTRMAALLVLRCNTIRTEVDHQLGKLWMYFGVTGGLR